VLPFRESGEARYRGDRVGPDWPTHRVAETEQETGVTSRSYASVGFCDVYRPPTGDPTVIGQFPINHLDSLERRVLEHQPPFASVRGEAHGDDAVGLDPDDDSLAQ
jgi:hypothetical protein